MINIKKYIYDIKEIINLIYSDYNKLVKTVIFTILFISILILGLSLYYKFKSYIDTYLSTLKQKDMLLILLVLLFIIVLSYYITLYPYKKIGLISTCVAN